MLVELDVYCPVKHDITIAAKFKFAWAKVPCAKAIAKAYEMRYGLGGENKAQVERWQRMTVQPKR